MRRLLVVLLLAVGARAQEYAKLRWVRDVPPAPVMPQRVLLGPDEEVRVEVRLGDRTYALTVTDSRAALGTGLPRHWMALDGGPGLPFAIEVPFVREPRPLLIEMLVRYRADPRALDVTVPAYRAGEVELAGRRRPLALVDGNSDLRFDDPRCDLLLLDVDGDLVLAPPRGAQERFPVGGTFRLGERVYRIEVLDPSGSEVAFHEVEAVPPAAPPVWTGEPGAGPEPEDLAGRLMWEMRHREGGPAPDVLEAARGDPALRGPLLECLRVLDPAAARTLALELASGPLPHPKAAEVLAAAGDAEAVAAALRCAGAWGPRLTALLAAVRDPAAIAVLTEGLDAKDPAVRGCALAALEATPGAAVTEALERRLTKEEDPELRARLRSATTRRPAPRRVQVLRGAAEQGDLTKRQHAIDVLLGLDPEDEAVRQAVRALLASRDDETRMLLLAALGDRRDRELVAAVAGCLEARRWQLRAAAAEALGRIRLTESIPPLVAQLEQEKHPRVQRALGQALHALTHENLYQDAGLWQRWWADRGGRFVVPAAPPGEAPKRPGERRTVAQFFGVPIESKHVIFVIDQSASMSTPEGGGSRWDLAVRELEQAAAALPPGARINVVFFESDVGRWRPRLTAVSKRTLAQLSRDLAARAPTGGTHLYDGLELAFADPDVEEICLLSDGQPSGGRFTTEGDILREVRRLNLLRRAVVNCVSLGGGSSLLRRLAKENDGTCVER